MENKSKSVVKLASNSIAEQIWLEIKDKPIDMFGLPSQQVHMHCTPVPADPQKLFLTAKVGAFLPALEAVLGSKYTIERDKLFIIIAKSV